MRELIACMVVFFLFTACSEDCRKKSERFYLVNEKALSSRQERNNFSMQLAYMPTAIMPGAKDSGKVTAPDTEYYHFRLQVQCPPNSAITGGDKTTLLYGLDSLFAAGGINEGILPVSVEPVVTGSSTHFEYLLVFAKSDLKADKRLEIIFRDRLFTNTIMSFVFDRSKIDEIELLHC